MREGSTVVELSLTALRCCLEERRRWVGPEESGERVTREKYRREPEERRPWGGSRGEESTGW